MLQGQNHKKKTKFTKQRILAESMFFCNSIESIEETRNCHRILILTIFLDIIQFSNFFILSLQFPFIICR